MWEQWGGTIASGTALKITPYLYNGDFTEDQWDFSSLRPKEMVPLEAVDSCRAVIVKEKTFLFKEADVSRPWPHSHNSKLLRSEFVFAASFTTIKSLLLLIPSLLISYCTLLLVCEKCQLQWNGQVYIPNLSSLLRSNTEWCLSLYCF